MESELVSSGVVEWGPFLILLKTSITAKILTLSRVLITKRDTLYIKDNDAWEKQDKEQSKIKEAIQNVSNAGYKLLSDLDMDDENTLQIVLEVTGGDGVDHEKHDDKIINLISKATTIEKV